MVWCGGLFVAGGAAAFVFVEYLDQRAKDLYFDLVETSTLSGGDFCHLIFDRGFEVPFEWA